MSQATVLAITGNAVIEKADGTTRALQVGEVVQRGDVIRTQNGARVELLLADGQTLAMGPNQAVRVDETIALTDATPQAADAAVQPTTVAEIARILEQGLDLLEQVDPAAAGAVAGGAGEGSSFVSVLRVVEPVDPLVFEFEAATFTVPPIEELPAVVGAAAPEEPPAPPLPPPVPPVTIDLAFTVEEESIPDRNGNDETDDGQSYTQSGNFLTGTGGVLTSFSVPGLGLIAIASGGSTLAFDAGGQVIPPGATTAPAVLLFVQPNGSYTLTVVGALNHPTPGTVEELLALSPIALVGTAGTGGNLTINLQLNVQDDVPVAVQDEGEGGLVPRADLIELDEDGLPNGNADDSRDGETVGSGSTIAISNIVDNVNWGADGFGRVTGVSWSGGSAAVQPNSSATLFINANGSLGTPESAAIRLKLGADGTYEFELLRAQTHGDQGEDLQALLQGGFTISAVDGDGDPIEGGVRVNVDVLDDIPVIELVGRTPGDDNGYGDDFPPNGYDYGDDFPYNGNGPLPSPQLTVDETNLNQDGRSGPGTVHFTVSFGADGPVVGGGKLYALEAEADTYTGLFDTATGDPVLISVDANGNVRGVVTVDNAEQTVFVMSVNAATGVVTFDQQRAVMHDDATNPNDSVSLAAGVINLRLTATDADGDEATATVDVGRLVSIADDGPSLKAGDTDSHTLDEDGLPGGNADAGRYGERDGGGSTIAIGSIVDNVRWGADGFGRVTGVSWMFDGESHSVDVPEGGETTIYFDADGQVRTGDNPAIGAAVSLLVNADGSYTVTLLDNLLISGEGENVVSLLQNGFTFEAVDGDGDPVPGGVPVRIQITDDVPVIQVADTQALRESFEGFVTLTGNSWTVVGEGGRTLTGNDGIVWTLNDAGIEIQRGNIGDAPPSDGEHKAELDAHDRIAGSDPNTLTVLSTQIDVPGTSFGMSFDYQPRPGDLVDRSMEVRFNNVVVTISANAIGVVTVAAPEGVTATQTPGTGDWTSIALVFDDVTPGLQTLSFAGTGQANSYGAYLDNIRLSANNPLLVDETRMGTDASGSGAAQRFTVSFGADGSALGNGGKAYDLVATNGTQTGLIDTATNQAVVVRLGAESDASKVFGVVTVNGVEQTVFVMSVNVATGVVTFDQQRAVRHPDGTNPNDSVSLNAGVISLRLTATDADGDAATATVDVGRLVSILDDAPTARNDTDSTANGLATGNVITGVDTTGGPTGNGVDAPGADGATVTRVNNTALQFDANNSGWSVWITGSHGQIRFQADGDYEYQANAPVPLQTVNASYDPGSPNVTVTAYTLGQSFFNASGQFASGGTGTVSSGGASGNHFGVAGTSVPNAAAPAQINYSGSLSEALAFAFTARPVTSATVSVSNLFQNEPTTAHGEAARWHAFDASGVRIGTGIISNNDPGEAYASSTRVTWTSNNVGTFTVSGIGAFSTLVIEALPYSEDGSRSNDDSDFFARVVSFQPQPSTVAQNDVFTYTLTDGDRDHSSATLTIQSSPQVQTGALVNLAPVAVGNSYSLAAVAGASVAGNIVQDDQGGGGAAGGRDWDPDTPVLNLSVATVIVNGVSTAVAAGGITVALAHGTLTIHPNGGYTYTVGSGSATEPRADSFQYVLRDVHGATSLPATVSFQLPAIAPPPPPPAPAPGDGAWFISHQGNENKPQSYKLQEGDGDDKGELHTFNVQFRPSNDTLRGKVEAGDEVTVVFDITGDASRNDFNVVGVNPSGEFSATWVLSADGKQLSVTLKNISGKEATLQGGPFDVTVQALADRVSGESDEVLKFELNASLTQRGVWEGNDFIQYTIEDEKAAATVFRFDMEDDTRGTAHVAGFDSKDSIEIHMEDVLDLKAGHDTLQQLLDTGIVVFNASNPQNAGHATLTIDSKSGESQTIRFDSSFALESLHFSVDRGDDTLKITRD